MSLFALPKCVLVKVLRFCLVIDVGQLESACCNEIGRQTLLSALNNDISEEYEDYSVNDIVVLKQVGDQVDPFVSWIWNRNIKCRKIAIVLDVVYCLEAQLEISDILIQILYRNKLDLDLLEIPVHSALINKIVRNVGTMFVGSVIIAPVFHNQDKLMLTDDVFIPLLNKARFATSLDLPYGNSLTAATFEAIADYCPSITSLSVGKLMVAGALSQCKRLTSIVAVESEFGAIKTIANCIAGTLVKLAIEVCHNGESTPNYQALANTVGENLRHLQLGSLAVTDGIMNCLASRCPWLTYLDMSNTSISGDALEAIGINCKQLKTLRTCNTGVDDHGVKAIIYNCDCIEVLDFDNCPKLTDMSSHAAGSHCTTLVYISFHRCPLVTDRFTELIIRKNLHIINVKYDINCGTTYGRPYHRTFPEYFKY